MNNASMLPSQSELIALKLKRKLASRSLHISPEKVMNVLAWLKRHSPLYADIDIMITGWKSHLPMMPIILLG